MMTDSENLRFSEIANLGLAQTVADGGYKTGSKNEPLNDNPSFTENLVARIKKAAR